MTTSAATVAAPTLAQAKEAALLIVTHATYTLNFKGEHARITGAPYVGTIGEDDDIQAVMKAVDVAKSLGATTEDFARAVGHVLDMAKRDARNDILDDPRYA